MSLIDRDFMIKEIEKAKKEKRTFDYDSLIDFIKVLPNVNNTEIEKIKVEIEKEKKYHKQILSWGRYYGLSIAIDILDKHIKGGDSDEIL